MPDWTSPANLALEAGEQFEFDTGQRNILIIFTV